MDALAAHVQSGMPWSSRVASSSWKVPQEVEAGPHGTLRWRGDSTGTPLTLLSEEIGEEGLVFAFARLADADDGEVVEFARRFGVLGLCDHDVPFTHVTGVSAGGWRPQYCIYRSKSQDDQGWLVEPVERWRAYARQANTILAVAAAFHTDSYVDEAVWEGFEELEPRWMGLPWERPVRPGAGVRTEGEGAELGRGLIGDIRVVLPDRVWDFAQGSGEPRPDGRPRPDSQRLEWALTQWLTLGDVRLWVSHTGEDFRVRFGGSTLFGALATEMALLVSRYASLFPCSGCGEAFVDESGHRSVHSKHWWCDKPKCKKKARAKASRDLRARKREKQSQASADRSPSTATSAE